LTKETDMEETTRKAIYFFIGIILPLILIGVSFIPAVANILLTVLAMVWLGFAIMLVTPAGD